MPRESDRKQPEGRARNRNKQTKIAERALRLKRRASAGSPKKPSSETPHGGMRPLPNTDIAPSGALDQEGHRPVLERSRKVR
jgi:hypothetical protein